MKIFAMVSMASSLDFTVTALKTFFAHTVLSKEDKFVLIDNDNSVPAQLINQYSVELLKNPTPLGFSQNANQMIRRSLKECADLYFLNNDLVFSEGWLEPLSIDAPIILSPLTNREVRYSTVISNTATGVVTEQFVCHMTMDKSQYDGHERAFEAAAAAHSRHYEGFLDVLALPFCCVKLPLPVMQAVGLFDENYGSGGAEDYDYSLRAYLAGFGVKYALKSLVLHFGGRSSWSSGEEDRVTQERREKFFKVFREKWGQKLYELILLESDKVLQEDAKLQAMIKDKHFKELIAQLMNSNPLAVYIKP